MNKTLIISGFFLVGSIGLLFNANNSNKEIDLDVDKLGPQTVSVMENGNDWIPANRLETSYNSISNGVKVKDVDSLARVSGGSMRPAFWEGNTVLLKEYSEEMSLQSGNVVLTEDGVLHTLVHNYLDSGGGVKIKGYNSESLDSVKESEIDSVVLGVLYTKQDKSGGVSAYAKAK